MDLSLGQANVPRALFGDNIIEGFSLGHIQHELMSDISSWSLRFD